MFSTKSLSTALAALYVPLVLLSVVQCNAQKSSTYAVSLDPPASKAVAAFAEGCFWCSEHIFEAVVGVDSAVSGYAGGKTVNPTYEEVCSETTGHAETVLVYYDPAQVSYAELVNVFFASHDPTTPNRQGPDRGPSYRSVAFYQNEREKAAIESAIDALTQAKRFSDPIITEVAPLKVFYRAEAYHQDYIHHHPENPYVQRVSLPRFERFRESYGGKLKTAEELGANLPSLSDTSLVKVEKSEAEWRKILSPIQYQVLREQGTEYPFRNPYWDNHEEGHYFCAACRLPLFASGTKFESGTGWPSFYEPIAPARVKEIRDLSHGMLRTEVVCARCEGHLGHVFDDGPAPTGLRYCMNSASLLFVPAQP